MDYPKISIVTPNFNGAAYLEETILSVLNQKYPNLEYIIIDGGSTDKSVEIIKKYESQITYWVSERDGGMYEAIQKGFEKSTGDIMGWLNSDDMLHPNSLFTLAYTFSTNPHIEWVEGVNTLFDKFSRTTLVHKPSKRHLIYYLLGLQREANFGYIQQESTYWKRNLWDKAGGKMNTNLKFAGDYDLWMRFFLITDIWVINTLIGGFRVSGENQLSIKNVNQYNTEMLTINSIVIEKLAMSTKKKKQRISLILGIIWYLPLFKNRIRNLYLAKVFRNKEII